MWEGVREDNPPFSVFIRPVLPIVFSSNNFDMWKI